MNEDIIHTVAVASYQVTGTRLEGHVAPIGADAVVQGMTITLGAIPAQADLVVSSVCRS